MMKKLGTHDLDLSTKAYDCYSDSSVNVFYDTSKEVYHMCDHNYFSETNRYFSTSDLKEVNRFFEEFCDD